VQRYAFLVNNHAIPPDLFHPTLLSMPKHSRYRWSGSTSPVPAKLLHIAIKKCYTCNIVSVTSVTVVVLQV
jgi:hypothetical protein